jgi:hypothetical protein
MKNKTANLIGGTTESSSGTTVVPKIGDEDPTAERACLNNIYNNLDFSPTERNI